MSPFKTDLERLPIGETRGGSLADLFATSPEIK